MIDAISAGSGGKYDPLDPQADCFRPPSIPTLVWCLHCDEEYDSSKMKWEVHTDADGEPHGFWCCGIDGCGGTGFGFDIFPVDEDYVDPDGREMGHWVTCDPPNKETDYSRPPSIPTPVRCARCEREYMSSEMIWFQDEDEPDYAFWKCPTKDCHGEGFGMDVRPTHPNFVDPDGRRILKAGEEPPASDFRDEDIPF